MWLAFFLLAVFAVSAKLPAPQLVLIKGVLTAGFSFPTNWGGGSEHPLSFWGSKLLRGALYTGFYLIAILALCNLFTASVSQKGKLKVAGVKLPDLVDKAGKDTVWLGT